MAGEVRLSILDGGRQELCTRFHAGRGAHQPSSKTLQLRWHGQTGGLSWRLSLEVGGFCVVPRLSVIYSSWIHVLATAVAHVGCPTFRLHGPGYEIHPRKPGIIEPTQQSIALISLLVDMDLQELLEF